MLETGLSWRTEGGGARPTDRCCPSGCRLDLLHFTRACLPFIHPFRPVRTPLRMRLVLIHQFQRVFIVWKIYKTQYFGNRNLTFKINFPFDYFIFMPSTGFLLNLGTILNLVEASRSQSRKLVVTAAKKSAG